MIPIAATDVREQCGLILTLAACGEPAQYAIRSTCLRGHRPVESLCRDHMMVYAGGLAPARPLIACNACLVDFNLTDSKLRLDHILNLTSGEVLEPSSATYLRLLRRLGVTA